MLSACAIIVAISRVFEHCLLGILENDRWAYSVAEVNRVTEAEIEAALGLADAVLHCVVPCCRLSVSAMRGDIARADGRASLRPCVRRRRGQGGGFGGQQDTHRRDRWQELGTRAPRFPDGRVAGCHSTHGPGELGHCMRSRAISPARCSPAIILTTGVRRLLPSP